MADWRSARGCLRLWNGLTGPPDPAAHAAMLRITGLPADNSRPSTGPTVHAYDEGKLTGLAFWQKFARDAGLNLLARRHRRAQPAGRAHVDHRKSRHAGLAAAAPDSAACSPPSSPTWAKRLSNLEREFDWLDRFDVLVWSYQQRMAKPDPAIYRHVLDRLGIRKAALPRRQAGEHRSRPLARHEGLLFSTVEQLRPTSSQTATTTNSRCPPEADPTNSRHPFGALLPTTPSPGPPDWPPQ